MGTLWTLVENYHLNIKICINSYFYAKLSWTDKEISNWSTHKYNINYFQLSIIIIIISSRLATFESYWGRKMSKSRSLFVDMCVQNNLLVFKNNRFTFSHRVTPIISQLRTWVLPMRNDRLSHSDNCDRNLLLRKVCNNQ